MAFFSTTTFIPVFLSRLGASNFLIGLVPALLTLGYTSPGVLVAGHIGRMQRGRDWLFPVALMERTPLLFMGIAAVCISSHAVLLPVFLALYVLHSLFTGLNQPAYWIVIAKAIPEQWRGRLMGFSGLAGGICGFAVLPITNYLLRGSPDHLIHGFGWCFIIGTVIVFATVLPLGFVREPISEKAESSLDAKAERGSFKQVWASGSGFRRFIWSQSLFSLWMISAPFYLIDGIRRLHIPGSEIGLYTTVSTVVGAFSGLLCGLLSDRKGNRVVLLIASAAGCLASLYALFVPSALLLTIVFALSAFANAGAGLAGYNITMEFAPTDRDVPYYIAFYNLVMSPVRAIALVAGGVISQNFNFASIFWISAATAAVSLALTWRIIEPRHTNARRNLEEPPI